MGRVFRRLASMALAAAIMSGSPAWAAETALDPLYRIDVTGGADSHGEIVLSYSEEGVETTQIPVPIPKGTPENNVARRIREERRHALRNTVDGTQISIARE